MRAAIALANRTSAGRSWIRNEAGTSISAPDTDASPTRFVTRTTAQNTTSTGTAQIGCTARTAPSEVATPLPPRPRSHGEVTWPSTAAKPATMAATGAPSSSKAITGRKPLRMSRTATSTPTGQPNARPALVAPGFPEPIARRSVPRTRAMIEAGFTEPTP